MIQRRHFGALAILLLTSLYTQAQYVGIGTTDPESILHITDKDSTTATVLLTPSNSNSQGNSVLHLSEDDDGTYGMYWMYDGTANEMQLFGKNMDNIYGPHLRIDRESSILTMNSSDNEITLNNETGELRLSEDDHEIKLSSKSQFGVSPLAWQSASVEVANSSGISTVRLLGTNGFISDHGGLQIFDGVNPNATVLASGNYQGGGEINIRDNAANSKITLRGHESSTDEGAEIKMYNAANEATIELDANWSGTGKSRIITNEIQINGGSDLAEGFVVSGSAYTTTAGMIVSIDPAREGMLNPSQEPYDKMAVGVVSGANGIDPGLIMGQAGSIVDGDTPVAIAGRVYVKSSDENGRIKPGDLLTSSSTPGCAMRVDNYMHAAGAIVGKALGSPTDDGYVLMLVSLQ